MAFDFAVRSLETPPAQNQPIAAATRGRERTKLPLGPALQWRQVVFGIARDALSQIEAACMTEDDHIWRKEAYQRALNYAELGMSEISRIPPEQARAGYARWNLPAIETLAGAYRLLEKRHCPHPVQCEHLLRKFFANLALTYAPVCGNIELALELCPLVLAPAACRALMLCAGMLIQGTLRHVLQGGCQVRLALRLAMLHEAQGVFTLQLQGAHTNLFDTAEFDLASRLCGIFAADLQSHAGPGSRLQILLTFPVSDCCA